MLNQVATEPARPSEPLDASPPAPPRSRPAVDAAGVETFASLVNRRILLPSQKTNYMAVEMNYLSTILAPRIREIRVDEPWYLERYPDIVVAIESGACDSAAGHYVMHGFYEHRMPHRIRVDEAWYLHNNPDVRRAVSGRDFASGQAHFDELGYREGRIPYVGFNLLSSRQ